MKLKVRIIELLTYGTNEDDARGIEERLKDLEDYQVKFITQDVDRKYTVFYSKDEDSVRNTDIQIKGGYIVSPSREVIWEKEGRLDGV